MLGIDEEFVSARAIIEMNTRLKELFIVS